MKKILVIVGHPIKQSFNGALAESYIKGAKESGAEVKVQYLGDLKFDPVRRFSDPKLQPLEGDLKTAQADVAWADHLVFVYPSWWGSMPAVLKGFFDRVFDVGFAIDYLENNPIPKKLLNGKSAHLIVTMDTPKAFFYLLMLAAGHRVVKDAILSTSGIKPVKITNVDNIRFSTPEKRERYINEIKDLGKRMA